MMFTPADGSVTIDHENSLSANIYNILITFGTDDKIVVWRAAIVPGSVPNKFEVRISTNDVLA